MEDTVIAADSLLVIDAYGFLFHILEEASSIFEEVIVGGVYSTLEDVIMLKLKELKSTKLDLLAVFDDGSPFITSHNRKPSLKDNESDRRRDKKDNAWLVIYDICHGRRKKDLLITELPMPPLVDKLYIQCLKQLQVNIIHCNDEADQPIAIICKTASKPAYCYGADTDFIFMKDTSYIPFGKLYVDTETNSCIASEVYRRSYLANAFGMSEEQVVEWSIGKLLSFILSFFATNHHVAILNIHYSNWK